MWLAASRERARAHTHIHTHTHICIHILPQRERDAYTHTHTHTHTHLYVYTQAVVQLFQSRRTLLRSLFDHFLSATCEAPGVARAGAAQAQEAKAPVKALSIDQAFGGQDRMPVPRALAMAWQLGLIPSFVTEQEAAEALAPGKIRALDHAPSLYVDMPGFVRGLGRMALRGDSHVRRPH